MLARAAKRMAFALAAPNQDVCESPRRFLEARQPQHTEIRAGELDFAFSCLTAASFVGDYIFLSTFFIDSSTQRKERGAPRLGIHPSRTALAVSAITKRSVAHKHCRQ